LCILPKGGTLNGAITRLIGNAKKDAKVRKGLSKIFDISHENIQEIYKNQEGKCYYSGINMNYSISNNWKMSLERLNPDLGYILSNVVLCCLEFNNRSQWSNEKINELLKIKSEIIESNIVDFSLKRKIQKRIIPIQEHIIDNIIHYNCTCCIKIKPIDAFNNTLGACKECISIKNKKMKYNPRLAIQILIRNAKSSSKLRKFDNIEIDFNFLAEIFNNQHGLCAYSGIPLNFGDCRTTNWVCSLERLNVYNGYTKEN
jgi:hypothetical protein